MSAGELDSTSPKQREVVIARSGGRCEAQVRVDTYEFTQREPLPIWTRCFTAPVEVHHALTRARGGDLLDRAGETVHLYALCLRHHQDAHRDGYTNGLMLQGYVSLDSATGRVFYSGPDPYLQVTYPDPTKEAC